MMNQISVIEYSKKQLQYIEEALHTDPNLDHRWNFKSGATQCGKTTVDMQLVIPFRIAVRKSLPGLVAILGVSLGTIERNVLIPMREYFASKGLRKQVSQIHKDAAGNTYVKILGQIVYLCGMMNKTAISRLRGSKFKYVYGDEVAEWNEEAFALLKSRMSLEYSCFDGACNPASDTHYLYAFIHSNIDIYLQEYTIFDNPFLSKKYVQGLCDEYAGTVYYDRYILGQWKKAEGLCYPNIANGKNELVLSKVPQIQFITCGVDFGGNKSSHTFTATGYGPNLQYIVVLEAKKIEAAGVDPQELNDKFEEFIKMVKSKYSFSGVEVRCDSAEQTLINGFVNLSKRKALGAIIKNAIKSRINDRITLITRLVAQHRLYWMEWAMVSYNAMATCVYNSKDGHKDERLDDGTTDIDSVDSTEYTIEPYADKLLKIMEYGQGRRL